MELKGGRYKNALRVLLDDSDRWIKGIYRQELEIKNVKRDTTIGVIISIVLSGLTIFMSAMLNRYKSGQGNIVDDWLYQGTAYYSMLSRINITDMKFLMIKILILTAGNIISLCLKPMYGI